MNIYIAYEPYYIVMPYFNNKLHKFYYLQLITVIIIAMMVLLTQ